MKLPFLTLTLGLPKDGKANTIFFPFYLLKLKMFWGFNDLSLSNVSLSKSRDLLEPSVQNGKIANQVFYIFESFRLTSALTQKQEEGFLKTSVELRWSTDSELSGGDGLNAKL